MGIRRDKYFLGIDFSSNDLIIVVGKGQENYIGEIFQNTLTDKMIPCIDKMLKKVHKKINDIEFIICGIGPGSSFTGLRIGISFIIAVSNVLKIPILPISSLKLIANYYSNKYENIYVALDAKQEKTYFAQFKLINGEIQVEYNDSVIAMDVLRNRIKSNDNVITNLPIELLPKGINYIYHDTIKPYSFITELGFCEDQLIHAENLSPSYIFNPFIKKNET